MNEDAKHEPLAIEHARAVGKATGSAVVLVVTIDDDEMNVAAWGVDRRACTSASKHTERLMRKAPPGIEAVSVVIADDPDDNAHVD